MQLIRRTPRFGGLPDLYTFECGACGEWHIEEGEAVVSRAADLGASQPLPRNAAGKVLKGELRKMIEAEATA